MRICAVGMKSVKELVDGGRQYGSYGYNTCKDM